MFVTTFLAVALVGFREEVTLIEVLQDARAANLAALRAGEMKVRATYASRLQEDQAELGATVFWDGESAFWSFHLDDRTRRFLPALAPASPEIPTGESYLLKTTDRVYGFNREARAIIAERPSDIDLTILEVLPGRWLSPTGVGLTQAPRSWAELIGQPEKFPESRFEVRRLDPDLVQVERRDPDGGNLKVVLSIAAAGNVVRAEYRGINRNARSERSEYQWNSFSGAVVLKELLYRASPPGDPDAEDVQYRLIVESIRVGTPRPPSFFSLNEFRKRYPADTRMQDKGGGAPSTGAARRGSLNESVLMESIPALKSRGFLKR